MALRVIIGTLDHMGGAEGQALYLVERLVKCHVWVLSFEHGVAIRPSLDARGVRIHVFPYY